MTQFIGIQTIVATQDTVQKNLPTDGVKGYLVGNESGLTEVIYMDGQGDSKSLYPGTVDYFPVRKGFSGTIIAKNRTLLNNVASWPSSFLQYDMVGINDTDFNASVYPLTLPRLTNIGNASNTVSVANSISNTNNPVPTNWLSVVPLGAGSTWNADNSGNLTVNGDIAGVLNNLLQLIVVGVGGISVNIGDTARTVNMDGKLVFDGLGGHTSICGGGLQINGVLTVNGVTALDGSKIITDGTGGLLSNLGTPKFTFDGTQPQIEHAVGNGTKFQEGGGANGFVLGRLPSQASGIIASLNNGGGIGFKTNGLNGTRLAQFKSTGDITINNKTYFTINAVPALTGGGVYDGGFDYAEHFPVDKIYEDFTVVCMNDYGQFTKCIHDKCEFASIISLKPAFCAGGGNWDEDEPSTELSQPIALVGRLKVKLDRKSKKHTYVTSNGEGNLRCMYEHGEPGFTLGYTLCDSDNEGNTFIMIRPFYIPYQHD